MNNIRKYFGEPSNIYESVSPFYYTLKFFGLASYSLNFKNGTLKTSFIGYIMILCFIAIYSSFIVHFSRTDVRSYSPEGKSVLIYGLVFFYFFQYASIILIFIYNFLKRENIGKLLKLLETFDDHCEKMGWKFKINHERNYWRSIFWIVFSLFSLCGVYALQMIWIPDDTPEFMLYIDTFFYCFMTNSFVLSSLQFIFSVNSVASRFEILNQNAM